MLPQCPPPRIAPAPSARRRAGWEITVDAGKVTRIRGDRDDVFSRDSSARKGQPSVNSMRIPTASVSRKSVAATLGPASRGTRRSPRSNADSSRSRTTTDPMPSGCTWEIPTCMAWQARSTCGHSSRRSNPQCLLGEHRGPDAQARVVRLDVRPPAHHPGARHRPHRLSP